MAMPGTMLIEANDTSGNDRSSNRSKALELSERTSRELGHESLRPEGRAGEPGRRFEPKAVDHESHADAASPADLEGNAVAAPPSGERSSKDEQQLGRELTLDRGSRRSGRD